MVFDNSYYAVPTGQPGMYQMGYLDSNKAPEMVYVPPFEEIRFDLGWYNGVPVEIITEPVLYGQGYFFYTNVGGVAVSRFGQVTFDVRPTFHIQSGMRTWCGYNYYNRYYSRYWNSLPMNILQTVSGIIGIIHDVKHIKNHDRYHNNGYYGGGYQNNNHYYNDDVYNRRPSSNGRSTGTRSEGVSTRSSSDNGSSLRSSSAPSTRSSEVAPRTRSSVRSSDGGTSTRSSRSSSSEGRSGNLRITRNR